MNKTTMMLVAVAMVALAGFIYLRSRPAPPTPETKQQTQPSGTQDIAKQPEATNSGQAIKTNMTKKTYTQPPQLQIDLKKTYMVTMKTSKGTMNFKLFTSETPKTVNNFVFLAREGFYNGTKFHRVISGFMIQGGDPLGNGTGGPGYQFADEPITRDYKRGVLAMANAGHDTNGSQFFVMHADTPLQKAYVIFGEVSDEASLKTVDAIASVPVMGETPKDDVVIESVEVEEK